MSDVDVQPGSLSPLSLQVIGEHSPQNIVVGIEMDVGSANNVISSAYRVIQSIHDMRRSALSICVGLATCKDAHDFGAKTGWDDFCKEYFVPQGLSMQVIRQSIKTGHLIMEKQKDDPYVFELFEGMKQAALFALSESPETFEQTREHLQYDIKVKSTDIRDLQEQLNQQKNQVGELKSDLYDSRATAAKHERIRDELNDQLRNAERAVEKLEDEKAELERKVKTPVESLVPTLPVGVKNESALKQSLDESITQNQKILVDIRQQAEKANEKLNFVQRQIQEQTQSADVLQELKQDVGMLTEKYSRALVKRVAEVTPTARLVLSEISIGLHALADQIAPSI